MSDIPSERVARRYDSVAGAIARMRAASVTRAMRSFNRSLPIGILLGMVLLTLYLVNFHGTTVQFSSKILKYKSKEDNEGPTSLLLVTAGRTGSSFTSAVISHHPDVFHTSEPLHGMPKDIYEPDMRESTSQKAQTTINAFLTCQFGAIDPQLFGDILFDRSESTRHLRTCLFNKKLSGFDHVACLLSATKQCEEKKVRFVKTIRYRAEWLHDAMVANPHLKVLYLVRDFRATLYSQARIFKTFDIRANCDERADTMCTNVLNDYRELEQLAAIFPGRIRVIRYEDGCLDPVTYSRNIYAFAGLPFTADVQEYVRNITNSKNSQAVLKGAFEIERADSIKTMNKWRSSAAFDLIQKIDTHCAKANEMFGYKNIVSEKQMKAMDDSTVAQPRLNSRLYQTLS